MKKIILNIIGSDYKLEPSNIYCVGKNYYNHVKEMGGSSIPEEPVIFLKPNSAIIPDGGDILIPTINGIKISQNLHYECELIILIKEECSNISESNALNYVLGYGVGLDMTLRDIQENLKNKGLPWAISKGFYSSAPISNFIPANLLEHHNDINFSLFKNGELKQKGNTKNLIFSIPYLISYLSKIFTLKRGDIIFTGTPEGVGKAETGDKLIAELDNKKLLEVNVIG